MHNAEVFTTTGLLIHWIPLMYPLYVVLPYQMFLGHLHNSTGFVEICGSGAGVRTIALFD